MCNDAVIRNNTLMGKPTEGALIALAMKVCACSLFFDTSQENVKLPVSVLLALRGRMKKTHSI